MQINYSQTSILEDSDEDDYMEPMDRFSSSEIVAAAKELRFTTTPQNKSTHSSSPNWHTMQIDDIVKQFNSSVDNGLNQTEITDLQQKHGYNQLTPPSQKNWILLYLLNFTLWLIIVSMILSLITGILFYDILILIFGILLLLLIIISFYGAFSNHRKQLQSSLGLLEKEVLLLRDSRQKTDESRNLVPGDIVFIKCGMSIEADIRIIECTENLEIDEFNLNGHIEPKSKNNKIANDSIEVIESHNMIFNGCVCINGECKGVVVQIGDDTLIGKVNKQQANDTMSNDSEYIILSDKSKFITALIVCIVSIVCFMTVLVDTKNVLTGTKNGVSLIGILWFAIGVTVIFIPFLLFCIIARLRAKIVIELLRENMFIKTSDAIYKLGDIDILCVDKNLLMTKDNVKDLHECIEKYDEMGIKIIIMSVDNKENIESIAKQCGYLNDTDEVISISGNDIDVEYSLDWNDILKKKRIIFWCISSTQKVTIVDKITEFNSDRFVCMTGDSANDCFAMKESDFSISLGIMGTDAAKATSDIVVMDDTLETIVKGIKISKDMKQSCSYKLQQKL